MTSTAFGKSAASQSRLFPLGCFGIPVGRLRRCIARYAVSSHLATRKKTSISFGEGFAECGTGQWQVYR